MGTKECHWSSNLLPIHGGVAPLAERRFYQSPGDDPLRRYIDLVGPQLSWLETLGSITSDGD